MLLSQLQKLLFIIDIHEYPIILLSNLMNIFFKYVGTHNKTHVYFHINSSRFRYSANMGEKVLEYRIIAFIIARCFLKSIFLWIYVLNIKTHILMDKKKKKINSKDFKYFLLPNYSKTQPSSNMLATTSKVQKCFHFKTNFFLFEYCYIIYLYIKSINI